MHLFPWLPALIRNSTLFVDDAPRVDMIVLLLLVQTENNKLPPSENDGNILSHLIVL